MGSVRSHLLIFAEYKKTDSSVIEDYAAVCFLFLLSRVACDFYPIRVGPLPLR